MSDEHVKLVAKIQYFYDVMMRRLQDVEVACVSSFNDIDSSLYKEKSEELNFLASEYSKTFETFLYKETKT